MVDLKSIIESVFKTSSMRRATRCRKPCLRFIHVLLLPSDRVIPICTRTAPKNRAHLQFFGAQLSVNQEARISENLLFS